MTTIPELKKAIDRAMNDLAQAKASIRQLSDRVNNISGIGGVSASTPVITIHGSLSGLGLDDHLQYVHISNARTIAAQHDFAPGSAQAPFTLGTNAQDQLVTGLNADELDGIHAAGFDIIEPRGANTIHAGPTSGGDADPTYRAMVEADIATHGIISKHSVSGATDDLVGLSGTTTLALITPSSNPGAAKAILKTTAAGLLTLEDLNITDDLDVGTGTLQVGGVENIVGINKPPVGGFDLDINTTFRTGGLATLGSLSVVGAAYFGDDLTVGANILFVDYSGQRIGIKRAADPQFQLDILGNLRASGWIVGKHAVQLEGANAIFHFDGAEPYESNYTGVSTGHKGQKPLAETAIIYRFGKFGKAVQAATATTNLVINSSWENGLTDWTNWGSPPTRAVVTTDSYYSSSSLRLVTDADNQGAYQPITVTSGQIYSASMYVKVESGTVAIRARSGTSTYVYAVSDIAWAGDGEWHRIRVRFTTTATTGEFFVGRVNGYGTSGEYWTDGIQLERVDSVTPYCDGSLGPGHSWSGSAHASTSSRVASTLEYPTGLTKLSSGTIMFWVRANGDAANSDHQYYIELFASVGQITIIVDAAGGDVRFIVGSSDSTGSTINDGEWRHVAITWDGTDAILYLDGAVDITHSSYSGLSGTLSTLFIGSNSSSIYQLNGLVDELAFLNRAADADEIASVYESGAPVFAETSTFEWSTPSITTWVDEEGLWSRGQSGQEVLGVSDVDSKSWGGITLDEGDVLIGNSPSFLWWDDSNARLSLTGKLIATSGPQLGGTVFQEIWDDGSSIDDWEVMQGSGELSIQVGGITGGSFLRVGDNSGGDQSWLQYKYNIPFDPNKSYKMMFRVRRTNGTGTVYAGVLSIGNDGITYHDYTGGNGYGPFHRLAANGAAPSSSWTVYEGYFRGTSGNGSAGPNNDPENPGALNDNATYFRPVIVVNYNTAGITEVDMEVVEMLPWGDDLTEIDGGRINTYSIDTVQLVATAIDAMTITGATIRTSSSGARVEMNSTKIFGTDGSDIQWEALNSTGLLTAGAGNVTLGEGGIDILATYAASSDLPSQINWLERSTPTNRVMTLESRTFGTAYIGSLGVDTHYQTARTGYDSVLSLWSAAKGQAEVQIYSVWPANPPTILPNEARISLISSATRARTFLHGYDFEGVIINFDLTASHIAPDALLDVRVPANGEGIKVDNAFVGRGGHGSSYANFSHWDYRSSTTSYGILHGASGLFLNAPSGNAIYAKVNGVTMMSVDSVDVNIQNNLTFAATSSLGTSWSALSFGTGWSNYGSGFQTCQYKRVGDLIFLRGLANSGANLWSTYPTIGTLPSGYRPSASVLFSADGNSTAHVRVDITSGGALTLYGGGGAGSGYVSLDSIIFSMD